MYNLSIKVSHICLVHMTSDLSLRHIMNVSLSCVSDEEKDVSSRGIINRAQEPVVTILNAVRR